MKTFRCDKEQLVWEATVSGSWSEELRAHVARCSVCREVAAVAGSLAELAAAPEAAPKLPDPGFLWWKVQLQEEYAKRQRVAKPLEVAEVASALVAVFSVAGTLFWQWPRIEAWLAAASLRLSQSLSSLGWTSALLLPLIALSALLLAVTVRLLVRAPRPEK